MKDFTNRTRFDDARLKKEIEIWLKNGARGCPFTMPCRIHAKHLCYQVFPGLENVDCPCNVYTLKYVIRIAKQAIKELGG